MKKIRALVVDDSALVRKLLTEFLNADPGIEVVGAAADPYIAREQIKKLSPDVLTLDVEMPRMDGLTFLSNLMRLHPMPVVMVSSLTQKGADVTLRALELGAVDFVSKPVVDVSHGLEDYRAEIVEKVKIASKARVQVAETRRKKTKPAMKKGEPQGVQANEKFSSDAILVRSSRNSRYATTDKIIAIGASTGGTEAVKEVISELPATSPGVVIAQHIPARFSGPWAKRMNDVSEMNVEIAEDGVQVQPGNAYVAPGDRHLLIERSGARWICRLNDGPPVNRHKPSVDVLFRSVANCAGHNAVGAILTGMGDDGAAGLLEMKESGAVTVAQDENTSVVWGMPGVAVKMDAVSGVLPLERIAKKLISVVEK